MMDRHSERGASLVLVLLAADRPVDHGRGRFRAHRCGAAHQQRATSADGSVRPGPGWRRAVPGEHDDAPDDASRSRRTYALAGGTAAVTLYRVKDDAIAESRVYAIKSRRPEQCRIAPGREDGSVGARYRAAGEAAAGQPRHRRRLREPLRPQQERHLGPGEWRGPVRCAAADPGTGGARRPLYASEHQRERQQLHRRESRQRAGLHRTDRARHQCTRAPPTAKSTSTGHPSWMDRP